MTPSGGIWLIAWIAAWLVVGFAILPYLTIVPATWLFRAVQQLSTAEFVTAVVGLLLGLLMGLLLGLPLAAFEGPLGTWLPLGVSLFLGPRHARPHGRQARGPAARRRGHRTRSSAPA